MLVSCDGQEYGCGGGAPDRALTWIGANGGLTTRAQYPYTSGANGDSGSCKPGYTLNPNSAPTGYKVVTRKSDTALMAAIKINPVILLVDSSIFQFYSSGVINSASCGLILDHVIVAVGYGVLDGVPYIKARNTWGANWGMDGYVLIGSDPTQNYCGILSYSFYPLL